MRIAGAGLRGAMIASCGTLLIAALLGAVWGAFQVVFNPGPNSRSEIALGWILAHAVEWGWSLGVFGSLLTAPIGALLGIGLLHSRDLNRRKPADR
ncbi:MAG: hypothetical protein ACO1SX_00555 [Actinomycetota bacterium]